MSSSTRNKIYNLVFFIGIGLTIAINGTIIFIITIPVSIYFKTDLATSIFASYVSVLLVQMIFNHKKYDEILDKLIEEDPLCPLAGVKNSKDEVIEEDTTTVKCPGCSDCDEHINLDDD